MSKSPISHKIGEIKPSGIGEFFGIALQCKDAISLSVGEPDFPTPWKIKKAAINAINQGKTYYTTSLGLPELRTLVSQYLKKKYNLDYDKDEIVLTTGSSEAIDGVFRAMIDDGDEVIVPSPHYVSYEPCVALAGGVTKLVRVEEKDGFALTPEQLQNAITPKSKILILNYPNNPTGAVMSKAQLEALVKIIIDNDLYVISDEIYSELVYDTEYTSIGSFPGMKERTIVLNGFSKAYSMTGWRLGYVAGPKNIIEAVDKIHGYAVMTANTISQYAAIAALQDCDADVAAMKEEYAKRRKYCLYRLKSMGLECFEPQGAFYVYPCIKRFGLSSTDFCLKLLNQERVVIIPGTAFGDAGEGFVRISYAYSIESLKNGFDKIEKFIKSL